MNKLVEKEKGSFNVGKFRFENEKIIRWVDLSKSMNRTYEYRVEITGIIPNNPTEGLLFFKFELELLPDIGKIEFNGDCILFSNALKFLVMILKADKNTILWKKNQKVITVLHKLLLRRCLDYSKEIGEKEGLQFQDYELVLKKEGLEHISFKKGEKGILSLKENKLVSKQNEFNIKNLAGFKDFIYYNEKVIPGKNSGKNIDNANFEVNSKLYEPKILSKKSLLIQYHFIMKISPDVGFIEFDGQFIMDSFKQEIEYLMKSQQEELKKVLQNIIAKAGIIYTEKIAKKYLIGFDVNTAFKKFGLI